MNEFLLSDETLNSHGIIIKTSGINMERFMSNPVMFLNHQRDKGVAGRWENLRIKNGSFYGTPVFDNAHEPGKTAKEQVESGFIKGASIGIRDCEIQLIGGVETVVKCELLEVSVCDIPSNRNTIQLYYEDKGVDLKTYKQLSLNHQTMSQDAEIELVLEALSLPKSATVKDVLSSINALKDLSHKDGKQMLRLAVEDNIMTQKESDDLFSLCSGDPDRLELYLQKKRDEHELALELEYKEIMNKKKIYFDPLMERSGRLKKFAMKDIEAFRSMVFNFVLEPIFIEEGADVQLRTLDDYRRYAPKELRDNPKLYRQLVEKENLSEERGIYRNRHNF